MALPIASPESTGPIGRPVESWRTVLLWLRRRWGLCAVIVAVVSVASWGINELLTPYLEELSLAVNPTQSADDFSGWPE